MVNKSGSIGTWTETASVNYAVPNGFPHAHRRRLKGGLDEGDVWLDPIGLALMEVKGGHAAEGASDAQVEKWMDRLDEKMEYLDAETSFLLRKRKGKGAAQAGQWWATWRLSRLAALRGYDTALLGIIDPDALVTMSYADALVQVRAGGYGSPLGDSSVSPTPGVDRLS